MPEPTTLDAARARSAHLEQQIAEDPSRFRVLTGERPTGPLHLGHYVGTLTNRVRLQEAGVELMLILADYQVITDRDDIGDLRATIREILLDYIAVGIDVERTTIFTHSAVPALNQLLLPFLSLVSVAELERNPTVKAETAATGGRAMSGLMLTYPVHQAADILFCKGNVVPVGQDQLPHLEMTRVVARRFNQRYSPDAPYFPEPAALLAPTPTVLGTDGTKMSKSRGNALMLSASEDETARWVKRAKTDAERHITYDPEGRPEVANLLDLLALTTGEAAGAAAERIGGGGAGALKRELTDALVDYLRPLRERRAAAAAAGDDVFDVLRRGNARANELADATLADVRRLMGTAY
ncbi:tryptophan--tRNA ligase [Sanguibacter sp. A247]|uniref:tryptophan--tRNA ligase n=1 Tax=unclassified Sanguibacter TaxID=2645534 RepID=UPI003FD8B0A8